MGINALVNEMDRHLSNLTAKGTNRVLFTKQALEEMIDFIAFKKYIKLG